MPTRQHRITPADAGQKLHRFARRWLQDVPLSAVFRMLRQGLITVNGRRASRHQVLRAGDVVEAVLAEPAAGNSHGRSQPAASSPVRPGTLDVVYEDEHILIVNKPAGLLVHPGSGQARGTGPRAKGQEGHGRESPPTLLEQVRASLGHPAGGAGDHPPVYRPSPAHRLDRNTSGLVAFGKTHTGAQRLSAWFRSGAVEKEYVAVVEGRPEAGRLVHGLRRDPTRRRTDVLPWRGDGRLAQPGAPGRASPKAAILDVMPLASRDGFSLVGVRLLTGRPHQIRAQMAAAGHPLVGDVKYGGRRLAGLSRPALHCYRLAFPGGIEALAPLPADLTRLCRRLGLELHDLATERQAGEG